MKGKIQFTWKVCILEAIIWQLHKETLSSALIDEAEKQANEAKTMVDGVPFADVDSESEILIEGENFVVNFRHPEQLTQDEAWKTRA